MGSWRVVDTDGLGPPMAGSYDWLLVFLSISVACLAGYAALSVVDRIRAARTVRGARGWLVAGALAMGGGIWAMHFTAMTAFSMRMPVSYDLYLTLVSIVPAVAGSVAALYWMSRPRIDWRHLQLGGLLMACGIGAMHYTAMAAAKLHHDPTAVVVGSDFSALVFGVAICGVTSLILGLAIIGTIVDRRLEAAATLLHESEAWANAVLDTAADGIIATDDAGTIISFNQAAARIFGYASAEMIGANVRQLMPAPFSAEHDGYLARYRATGVQRTIGSYREVQGLHKNGNLIPIEIGIRELVREDGLTFIGCVRDIAERRALQAQLAQSQKLESIGQLAAGVAHEINTPIQFVGDNTRFLEGAFDDVRKVLEAYEEVAASATDGVVDVTLLTKARAAVTAADLDYLDDEIPKAIREALEGIERVSRIVAAMKDFSHPGSKDKQPIDLNRAIESTATVSRNEWKYVAELVTELDAALPPVPCFAGEINQVVLNIIVNAAHAIAAAKEADPEAAGRITVATRRDDGWAEIRISDTGTGMSEEIRAKIFDPFFTTKEVGKGTGQGLAIAHAVITEKHGGTIRVESEVGRGSTFVLRLPLASEPAAAGDPVPLAPVPAAALA